jgi:hypothetical protein
MHHLFRKLNPFKGTAPAASPMQRSGKIDIVGFDRKRDRAILSLIETRQWGDDDKTLFDLQEKLNTYIGYVEQGRLVEDYPQLRGKVIEFRLQTMFPLRPRDEEFIESVRQEHLQPRGIEWKVELIRSSSQQ